MSALTFLISWPVLLIGLVFLASLSPLLTFTKLFQLKEWRWDRLREHGRQEGWWNQLFGKIRGWILIGLYLWLGLISSFFLFSIQNGTITLLLAITVFFSSTAILGILAVLTIVQLILHKQPLPVWTNKARLTCSLSCILAFLMPVLWIVAITSHVSLTAIVMLAALPLFVFATPAWVLITWTLLLPIDHFLKNRTFKKAQSLRATLKDPIVIGIAGSVGKTTVKELLATVLADLHPLTTPEHVNTEMGVSQWLLHNLQHPKLETQNSKLLIIELGAYRKGEIALLSSIIRPTLGVVTALGSDHLALFGSEEAIIEANGELIEALPADGHAFLYGDNPGARSLTNRSPCPATLVGMQNQNDLRAHDILETPNGLHFVPTPYNLQPTTFVVPLHGTHNVGNILLAIAVARHLGIDDDRIKTLLASHQSLRTTFNVRREQGILLLDDTYNISPLSLRAAIDWANERTERPRILLTSGLLETGPEEDRFHEELGAYAKGKLERVIFTSERGRTAFAQGCGSNVELLTTTTEPASAGSALLCVGRMTPATIHRFLPKK